MCIGTEFPHSVVTPIGFWEGPFEGDRPALNFPLKGSLKDLGALMNAIGMIPIRPEGLPRILFVYVWVSAPERAESQGV